MNGAEEGSTWPKHKKCQTGHKPWVVWLGCMMIGEPKVVQCSYISGKKNGVYHYYIPIQLDFLIYFNSISFNIERNVLTL